VLMAQTRSRMPTLVGEWEVSFVYNFEWCEMDYRYTMTLRERRANGDDYSTIAGRKTSDHYFLKFWSGGMHVHGTRKGNKADLVLHSEGDDSTVTMRVKLDKDGSWTGLWYKGSKIKRTARGKRVKLSRRSDKW